MTRSFLSAFAALILCAAIMATARAQNLVTNGNFDNELAAWDFPDATPTWTAFDSAGAAGSGSAYFVNTQAAAGARQLVLRQCIQVTQTGAYVFSVAAFTPTGQASTGSLIGSYSVDLHHSDCSGGWNTLGGFYMPSADVWTVYATDRPSNPAMLVQSLNPQASIAVELSVEKTPAGGSFGGYFDAVYLIRDTLFMDGFEPGP